MILAALLFITRVSDTTTVSEVTDDYVEDGRMHILQDKDIPYYATIFRIHGPFLFGATDKIASVTENLHRLPPVVIIRLRNMTAIDATGLYALEDVAQLMRQAEFEEVVGRENICANVGEALRRAEEVFERITPRTSATAPSQ
jgi:SulP family sulfate permease